jgi:hypothetical protein
MSVFEEEPEQIYKLIDSKDFIEAVKRFPRLASLVINTITKHLERLEEAARKGAIDKEHYNSAKERIKKFVEQISPVSVPEKLHELLGKPEFLTERVAPTEKEEPAVDFAKVELYYKLMNVLSKDPEFYTEKSLLYSYKGAFDKAIEEEKESIRKTRLHVSEDTLNLLAFDKVTEDLVFGEGVSVIQKATTEEVKFINFEEFERGILSSLKEYLSRKIAYRLAIELIESTTLSNDDKRAIINGLKSEYKNIVDELSSEVPVEDVSLFIRRVYRKRLVGPEKGIFRVTVRNRVYEEILDPTSEMSIESAINDVIARAVEDLVKDKSLHGFMFQKISEKTGKTLKLKPSLYVEKPEIYGLNELRTLITDLTDKFTRIEDIGLSKQVLADILAETDRALLRLRSIFKEIPAEKLLQYLEEFAGDPNKDISQFMKDLADAIKVVKQKNKEIYEEIHRKTIDLKDTILNLNKSLSDYRKAFELLKGQPFRMRDAIDQFLRETADNINKMDELMSLIFKYLVNFAVFSVKEEQYMSKISDLMNKYSVYRNKVKDIYQKILDIYNTGKEDVNVILNYLPEIQVPEEISSKLIESLVENIDLDLSNLLEDRERTIEDESRSLEELYKETEGEYKESEEEIKGLLGW